MIKVKAFYFNHGKFHSILVILLSISEDDREQKTGPSKHNSQQSKKRKQNSNPRLNCVYDFPWRSIMWGITYVYTCKTMCVK